jgi:outer membrane protein insertion porin family
VLRLSSRATLGWALLLATSAGWAAASTPTQTEEQTRPEAISAYLGVPVSDIELPGVEAEEAARMLAATPVKAGEPLTRQALHDAIQALFATGRFADIQAEAERTSTGVKLRFLTVPNYFVGQVTVEGVTTNPSPNQLATATRLQLGELYTQDKKDRALAGINRVLADNGYHQSKVTISEQPNEQQHQKNLAFHVTTGPRALVGKITVDGDTGYPKEEIEEIAKFHSGDPIISTRLTRALQRIRTKYQKQGRLLAQVSAASETYHPTTNTVDYVFQVDRGPVVEVSAEGFKISKGQLKKLVPIYEEGAVDDDLLNEGRRTLQNFLQTRGYFDATVSVSRQSGGSDQALRVVYVIDPGDRHKLTAIRISGNHFFDDDQIRGFMDEQPAGHLFSHGRYSEALLTQDVRNIQDQYRAQGYRQVEVSSKLLNNYQNDPFQLAIQLSIKEGAQTRVAWVRIEGNYSIPSEQILPKLSTEEGQGFKDSDLADDRDTILAKYFNSGFTNANVDVSYVPVASAPGELPKVGVTFAIQEGEQFFVHDVFVGGLHYTRPGVARRELEVEPGAPLSQRNMIETQRQLYGLGLFNEVDTAIQNPEGTESRKNVLVALTEARRYTFDYGVGFEFQTGQPSFGTNQPLGQTGVSPRVSFALNRINFGGRNQTVTLKSTLSRLQQRGLIGFEAPKLAYRDLRFTATALYDNTVDVSTFTSQRTEGNVRAEQALSRSKDDNRVLTSIAYGFSYRRVQASNIEVTQNLIPLLSKPTRVGGPTFLYLRNRRDNDLETTRGNYNTLEGSVAAGSFGSEADFSRLLIKNATYYSFARNKRTQRGYVFARATTIGVENPFGKTILLDPSQTAPGTTIPAGHTLIPLPERFFSGGGNSHRGFGLNQAGPRDAFTGFPVGGSALFLNSLELRFPNITLPYLQDNIGFTFFHDMGNVFARPQEMLSSIARWHQPNQQLCFQEANNNFQKCNYNYVSHAIGLGVRYQTPIGPLRFDLGYNLNPPAFPAFTNIVTNPVTGITTGQFGAQRAGRFNFSFSIGQSF